jgi:hypothetical protein
MTAGGLSSPTTEPAGRHLNERSENNTPQIAHLSEKNRDNGQHQTSKFQRNAANLSTRMIYR